MSQGAFVILLPGIYQFGSNKFVQIWKKERRKKEREEGTKEEERKRVIERERERVMSQSRPKASGLSSLGPKFLMCTKRS